MGTTYVKWSNDLETGIVLIDNQHKKLLKHIDDFFVAMKANKGSSEITSVLVFMEDYTDFHFQTEEKHMIENNYPGYRDHKKEHEILKKNIRILKNALSKYGDSKKLEEIVEVQLLEWYKDHIKNWDKDFARFLTL